MAVYSRRHGSMEAVERSRANRARAGGCAAAVAVVVAVAVIAAPSPPTAGAGVLCQGESPTLPLTADAKVSSVHPKRRYGRRDTWTVNYGPATARSYISFDLPEKPMGCRVTAATLDLRGRYSGQPNSPTEFPGATVDMWLVDRGWNERKITWNNRPRKNGCDAGTGEYAESDRWDLTGVVQKAYECPEKGTLASFEGLKLKGWSPRGRGARWKLSVDSRESSHPPAVTIIWGDAAP
jgi:hypothetical protein